MILDTSLLNVSIFIIRFIFPFVSILTKIYCSWCIRITAHVSVLFACMDQCRGQRCLLQISGKKAWQFSHELHELFMNEHKTSQIKWLFQGECCRWRDSCIARIIVWARLSIAIASVNWVAPTTMAVDFRQECEDIEPVKIIGLASSDRFFNFPGF